MTTIPDPGLELMGTGGGGVFVLPALLGFLLSAFMQNKGALVPLLDLPLDNSSSCIYQICKIVGRKQWPQRRHCQVRN